MFRLPPILQLPRVSGIHGAARLRCPMPEALNHRPCAPLLELKAPSPELYAHGSCSGSCDEVPEASTFKNAIGLHVSAFRIWSLDCGMQDVGFGIIAIQGHLNVSQDVRCPGQLGFCMLLLLRSLLFSF